MTKRKRDDKDESQCSKPLTKRTKALGKNHFDNLSDELVLRTLSFLSVTEITSTERTCRRFRRLGSDNEIWREKFYNQFVRPRARRLPGLNGMTENERERHALHYASKSARWLEHSSRSGVEIDWKRRYKVKLNWSKGRCRAHEMALDCPIKPRLLVKMSQGMIITASEKGLRSYSQRSRPQLLHTHTWAGKEAERPTALSVDLRDTCPLVTVGFSNGSFETYAVAEDGALIQESVFDSSNQSPVASLAMSWPYLLRLSDDHEMVLSEFRLDGEASERALVTLASLKSDTTLSPVSLSIRKVSSTLVASIAYSFSRLNSGWCLGLQEIRLNLAGDVMDSRLTSTVDTPLKDFPLRTTSTISSRSASTGPLPLHPQLMHPPNSLSHSGCYILAGLPDNTLMVYTITSDKDKLEINAGRRLWGHTSSVSGAEVTERGKALSVSAKGDEIRVWELEDILSSYSLRKTSTELKPWPHHQASGLNSALTQRGNGIGLALQEMKQELAWTRHWVGFDDEQVVVLGERDQRQILSCYDFA